MAGWCERCVGLIAHFLSFLCSLVITTGLGIISRKGVYSHPRQLVCYDFNANRMYMYMVLLVGYLLFGVGDFVGGSIAAGTATTLCHPLDVLRTRFIAQGEPKVC